MPVLIVWLVVLMWGFTLLVTAIGGRFRDAVALAPVLVQAGIFFTPVATPSSAAGSFAKVLAFNPASGVIEAWRWSLLGIGAGRLRYRGGARRDRGRGAAGLVRVRADGDPLLGLCLSRTAAEPRTDLAVRCEGVGKSYGLGEELSLQHTLSTLVRREHEQDRFWALSDVSFEVHRGESFGIVGTNGSGKSTLTQVISGIAMQDTGKIEVWGRLIPLLEVGAGFHPELTGRENVELLGTILGLSAGAIRAEMDRIAEFAGVERHLDTPIEALLDRHAGAALLRHRRLLPGRHLRLRRGPLGGRRLVPRAVRGGARPAERDGPDDHLHEPRPRPREERLHDRDVARQRTRSAARRASTRSRRRTREPARLRPLVKSLEGLDFYT